MRTILVWCSRAVEKAQLALWPSTPIASSNVPENPGLLQWLALADSRHCAPLVESCLSQLLPSDSNDTIRRALASPHLRKMMDGLHSETKTGIMCKMAGLPLGFQVNMYTALEVLVGFEWSHSGKWLGFIHLPPLPSQAQTPEIGNLEPDVRFQVILVPPLWYYCFKLRVAPR